MEKMILRERVSLILIDIMEVWFEVLSQWETMVEDLQGPLTATRGVYTRLWSSGRKFARYG